LGTGKLGAQTHYGEKRRLQFGWQFLFPGGIARHTAPETRGSIHEGGELGYSLSHAYGAALDNPDREPGTSGLRKKVGVFVQPH
jgi:phosphoketolase